MSICMAGDDAPSSALEVKPAHYDPPLQGNHAGGKQHMLVRRLAALAAATALVAVMATPASASPPVGCVVTIVNHAVATHEVKPCP
jgi:hypothetical protein